MQNDTTAFTSLYIDYESITILSVICSDNISATMSTNRRPTSSTIRVLPTMSPTLNLCVLASVFVSTVVTVPL
jgi:hypothetical protein